ncbi:hypothetical protein [Klebsiella pneumoniae]|uniref:hypothetical protein n=1 Tax=Klebsiella pneumoniae TaxID=573 RepID=UPI003F5589D3
MNIETVNELIQSLESAGELSIREQKFLKLAKAFKQLASENVEAKKIISECREYFIAGVMNRIRPTNEGYLHMICDTFADETPATDRIVAGIKADAIDEAAVELDRVDTVASTRVIGFKLREFAKQLREGADK